MVGEEVGEEAGAARVVGRVVELAAAASHYLRVRSVPRAVAAAAAAAGEGAVGAGNVEGINMDLH